MKRKYSNYENNSNFLNTEFIYEEINSEIFKGTVSYLKINKVKNPVIVKRNTGEEICICDSGYSFISIYEYNKNYAITVMYGQNEELVQLYFDIIKETGIEKQLPYIDDLYVDIVVSNDNVIEILDEEELEEALNNKLIKMEEFNLANKSKVDLYNKLQDISFIQNIRKLAKMYLENLK